MYSYIFKEKLNKLNPSLYLKEDNAIARTADARVSGIYSKVSKRDLEKSNLNYLDSGGRRFLEAQETGNTDTFITGCPTGWIPEYDVLDVETGRIESKGWRTIVLYLIKERLCSLSRAKTVFTSSLGEHTWDRGGYDNKLAIVRKEAKWKSAQQRILETWNK